MKRALAGLLILVAASAAIAGTPSTTDNDDTCDIGVAPAATLFLPYFEVDFRSPPTTAQTTIFTIQNTTAMPQIARVTLWTDWAYPILTFNLFLTGYGVQAINLYDVFAHGVIAFNAAVPGELSLANDQNPNFLPDAATTCSGGPSVLGGALLADLQNAFIGSQAAIAGCAITTAAGPHANAVGYATIDVVANCNATTPLAAEYFTREILFDNVLTGDYQHVAPNPVTGNYAGGSPLVHIRAIPEGGPAGAPVATTLPFTFYDLYTAGAARRTQDRRQPLPSAFMARYVQGGTGAFNTNLQIWREAIAAPAMCPTAYRSNSSMQFAEAVRFDEHENATIIDLCGIIPECRPGLGTAVTQSWPLVPPFFPSPSTSGDVGGWLFFNARNFTRPRPSQAWIVTSRIAEGRFAVEVDAAAIGNGCSPAAPLSRNAPIGPAPNSNP